MKFEVDVNPSLSVILNGEIDAGERAVTSVMRRSASGLKSAWRGQVTGAGLGRRLANTIRGEAYPRADMSLEAAALVWSKAPRIVGAHERGVTIHARRSLWLAIPTESAGRGRRRRITPAQWEERTGRKLRFVPRRGRAALLVDDGTVRAGAEIDKRGRRRRGFKNRTVPIFVLVRQVRLPKRLNLYAAARQAQARLPSEIVAAWRATR